MKVVLWVLGGLITLWVLAIALVMLFFGAVGGESSGGMGQTTTYYDSAGRPVRMVECETEFRESGEQVRTCHDLPLEPPPLLPDAGPH